MPLRLEASLAVDQLYQLGEPHLAWELAPEATARVAASYARLTATLDAGRQQIYGLHTHFGHNSADASAPDAWREHQLALLEYLHVGAGTPLAPSVVRRALRLQAYKVGLGYSGVHPRTFARLQQLADAPELAVVPSLGSLGASGDLIPMAHALQPLFRDHPPEGPRDVLALVNTNAVMASLAVDCWMRLRRVLDLANCGWLLHSEAVGWVYPDFAHQARGWQARSGGSAQRHLWIEQMRSWHQHLAAQRQNAVGPEPAVQARYSLRCAPQVLVDIEENLAFAALKTCEEALGLADNPIVLDSGVWHGGLFYTAGLSSAAELMQNAVLRLGDLMDRQILQTVTPEMSYGLPTNLRGATAGDHVKGLHQLASALQQRIKGLSLPPCLLSFSCESNNQDIVPASMTGLLQVQEGLALVEEVSRIHAMVGERAWLLRDTGEVPEPLSLARWDVYRSSALLERYHRALRSL